MGLMSMYLTTKAAVEALRLRGSSRQSRAPFPQVLRTGVWSRTRPILSMHCGKPRKYSGRSFRTRKAAAKKLL